MRALYMEDNRCEHQSVITQIGSSEINKKLYSWIQLSETIFHPKGGGQPSDEGRIAGIQVAHVHKDVQNFEIYHCFESPFNFKIGDAVTLVVDETIRFQHSKLHTAGHVLAEAVNICFPEIEAYQGNHYPNNSYVKFKMRAPMQIEDKQAIKLKVEAEFNPWIDQDFNVTEILEPSGIRKVKVFQNWSPCGGTHVKSLREIGKLEMLDLSINKKEGVVTIKYAIS